MTQFANHIVQGSRLVTGPDLSPASAGRWSVAGHVGALIRTARVRHWVKNVFVLAPLVFAPHAGVIRLVPAATIGFFCFCLLASAVYFLNDAVDAEKDRNHPTKRMRPVAAGDISKVEAMVVSGTVAACAFAIGWRALPAAFCVFAALYLANNLLYSFVLKAHVIIDVMSIAIGFVLRLLAGATAIGVTPTSWLLVCGFCLALLLGFGKRRSEIGLAGHVEKHRETLSIYNAEKVDTAMAICAALALVTYMLYTVAAETRQLHGTDKLAYTVPFVVYGIFRFIFKVQEGTGAGPVDVLAKDPIFFLNGLGWGATVLAILWIG